MKSETRANLLFLGLFLAVSLPGAVILFKKKLDPMATSQAVPDSVRRRLPYMVPMNTPDSEVIRVIPPLTAAWVEELRLEQGGGATPLMNGPLPVTSVDRVVQVAGVKQDGNSSTVHFLAWEGGRGGDPAGYDVTATTGGETFAGRLVRARTIAMPQPVKRELMSGGYIKPPAEVTWIEVSFDAPVASRRPLTFDLNYKNGSESAWTTLHVLGN